MNYGDRPYCGEFMGFFEVPERTPAWAQVECEECGKTVWYKFSRVDPECFTVEEFNERFIIDEENRTIEERQTKTI